MKSCFLTVWGYRALTFAIVYLVFGLPNLRVTPANYRTIRHGMTEREVEKILGAPSDVKDVSRYRVMKAIPTRQGVRYFRLMKTKAWTGVDRVIVVDFGEKGTVEWSKFQFLEEWAEENNIDSGSLLEEAQYWLITEPVERLRNWLITEPDE